MKSWRANEELNDKVLRSNLQLAKNRSRKNFSDGLYTSIFIIISYVYKHFQEIETIFAHSRRKYAITFIISEDELSCYYEKACNLCVYCTMYKMLFLVCLTVL